MKREKTSAWQGFVQALNLPENAFVSQCHMELFGQKELIIEDAKSILEYSEELVRIQAKGQKVLIQGQQLRVDMFLEKVMIVRGKISTISFE